LAGIIQEHETVKNSKSGNVKLEFYSTHFSDKILSDLASILQMLLIKQKYILLPAVIFKRTYERWGLKDGEGKLRIETSGGE
jgi:hypothetical protein